MRLEGRRASWVYGLANCTRCPDNKITPEYILVPDNGDFKCVCLECATFEEICELGRHNGHAQAASEYEELIAKLEGASKAVITWHKLPLNEVGFGDKMRALELALSDLEAFRARGKG